MASKQVYRIPHLENINGLNLYKPYYWYVFENKIDDEFRLSRTEDVLIATYPRTGTTWMGQIVTLLQATDEDYDAVRDTKLRDRYPYLELSAGGEQPGIARVSQMPPPRTLKTHLIFRMIRRWIEEDNVKTIVTSRNPKDTLVSLFHIYKQIPDYGFEDKTWAEFFEHVQAGLQDYGDQYDWLLDWCNNKDKGEILFVAFEDLKADPGREIQKIADFRNIELSTTRLEKILHDSNIKQMKISPQMMMRVGDKKSLIRSGQTGSWRSYFTVAQNQWYDEKYKQLYEALPIKVHYE